MTKRVTYAVDVPEHDNGAGTADYAFEGLPILMSQGHFAASTVSSVGDSPVIDCYAVSTVAGAQRQFGDFVTDLGANDGAYKLIGVGGLLPYTFSVPTPAQLPPGVTIGSNGVTAGSASLAGTYNVSVTITDAIGSVRTRTVQFVVTDP